MVTLFWGGYDVPFLNDVAYGLHHGQNLLALFEVLAMFGKICCFISFLCGCAGPFRVSATTS